MELLEEFSSNDGTASCDADTLLPPLPPMGTDMQTECFPALAETAFASSSGTRAPAVRNRSYRQPSKASTAADASTALALSPAAAAACPGGGNVVTPAARVAGTPPLLMAGRGSATSSGFGICASANRGASWSRPTTAGGESASLVSSASWRDEWTPGHEPTLARTTSRTRGAFGLRPPPVPPLPPNPATMPVDPVIRPATSTRPPSKAGGGGGGGGLGGGPIAWGESGGGGSAADDDEVLKRFSQSALAKAANPPPIGRRVKRNASSLEFTGPPADDAIPESLSRTQADPAALAVSAATPLATTPAAAGASPPPSRGGMLGGTPASTQGFGASGADGQKSDWSMSNFSELALGFAALDDP